MRSLPLLGLVVTALLAAVGCAPAEEEDTADATADAISVANGEFERTLAEIEDATKDCGEQGCPAPGAEGISGTKSIAPLAGPRVAGRTLCSTLRPLSGLGNPYFFMGASANATAIRKLFDGGVDLVFDLRNQQAALFHYHNDGYSNLVGIEANVYTGYGFGRKANVIDAWSGEFQSADATVELPVLNIGVGGNIFRAPDNSIIGGAVEATIGFNALGPLGTVEVSASEGEWTPWDNATRVYGRSLFLARYREGSARFHGKQHAYLQFNGTRDLGVALVQTGGVVLGGQAAAYGAAVAALKKSGLTYEQMCRR